MHFYDSVVVFERGAYTKKWGAQTGGSMEKVAALLKGKLRLGNLVS